MKNNVNKKGPIGVFDSGVGGLTVFSEIKKLLPAYDFIYLGDNARTPYGNRSFETIYKYTLEAVEYLFDCGCPLIILACNTASAKALKTIQMNHLSFLRPDGKVLGIIRPTVEEVSQKSKSLNIGILSTLGTVNSKSYLLEFSKLNPNIRVFQQACPMWVPMVEAGEVEGPGAEYFVKKEVDHLLNQNDSIDTILLGCTHYPLLLPLIKKFVPDHISILSQGDIVAHSLKDYLRRHPEIHDLITTQGTVNFYTTDNTEMFNQKATIFYDSPVSSQFVVISM
jgi:glutamate racemase